jgi:hypothetical protein
MANRFFMMTITILLMSCASNKIITAPDWFLKPLSHPDTIYATGVDSRELYAISSALINVGFQNSGISNLSRSFVKRSENKKIENFSIITDQVMSHEIANINLTGMRKRFQEEINDKTAIDHFTSTYEIISTSPEFIIRSTIEEKDDKVVINEKESLGITASSFKDELKKNNISIKIKKINNLYYCSIGVSVNLIDI